MLEKLHTVVMRFHGASALPPWQADLACYVLAVAIVLMTPWVGLFLFRRLMGGRS